jgi:hypothetical protein
VPPTLERLEHLDAGFCFRFGNPTGSAETAILRYQSQGVDDLFFGRATAIEDSPLGFDEGTIARFALVALTTCLGLAKSDDVRLAFTLQLTIIVTL